MRAKIIFPAQNLHFIMLKFSLSFLLLFSIHQVLFPQTTYYVTDSSDSGPGSLRNVLSQASAGTTIRFVESVDTVFLTSGELLIDKSINITGNPPYICIIKQDTLAQFRLIRIQSTDSLHVEFNSLAMIGGHAPDGHSAAIHGQHGGGIFIPDSIHQVVFMDCRVEENIAGDGLQYYESITTGRGGSGAGIYSSSKLQLYNCLIYNNIAGKGANASSGGDWDVQHAGSGGSGGGIYCINDLVLESCKINYNQCGTGGDAFGGTYSAGGNGGAGGSGGAIYCHKGMINITNSEMNYNSGGKGGNASNYQSSCSGGAAGNGGAIYLSVSSVTISSSDIRNNSSGNGGSGSGNESGHGKNGGNGGGIYAINCVINLASTGIDLNYTGTGGYSGGYSLGVSPGNGGAGGGIYLEKCNFNFENCLISENSTGNGASTSLYYSGGGHGGSGGGFYIHNALSNSCIRKCRFENNLTGNGGTCQQTSEYTPYSFANGGSGGGLAITGSDSVTRLINCVFTGNSCGNAVFKNAIPPGGDFFLPEGGSGGGIYINASHNIIINSTIANNTAGTALIIANSGKELIVVPDSVRGKGGGIMPGSDTIEIINSIIANNYLGSDSIQNDIEGIVLMSYSLLSDDSLCTVFGNENLLNTDPRFLSFPDDLSLAPTSFAINHGSPDTNSLSLPALDLAGNPRIYSERIDMGAYEFQGEPQGQYIISPDIIVMDSLVLGGFAVDSLNIRNYGLVDMTITKIQTGVPFSLSLDKIYWAYQLYEVNVSAGDTIPPRLIYVKYEGIAPGPSSNNIVFTISEALSYIQISGFCKNTEGIHEDEDENKMKMTVSPNPFNRKTTVAYSLEQIGNVNIIVLSSSGKKVDEITFSKLGAGSHSLTWNRNNLPDGLYFMIIKAGKKTGQEKLIILSN